MKVCKKCGGSERYKPSKSSPFGNCKQCSRAACDLQYKKNKNNIDYIEKAKANGAAWYSENSEKVKASSAKRYAANPEKVKANSAKNYADNPDKRKKRQKVYRLNNKEKTRAWWHKHHAQKKMAIPLWFGELDKLIMYEAADLCIRIEKATGIKWEMDHTVPLQSKFVCGFHIGCNIQVIPRATNRSKQNRHWPDMP